MSGKQAKAIRKLAKEELEKRMNPNQVPQKPAGIQVISALEEFIQLCTVLIGEKPASLTLTDVMYNSYIQESQRHGEVLGLKTGFQNDEPSFNGVKLVKKSPISIPDGVKTEAKSSIETSSK